MQLGAPPAYSSRIYDGMSGIRVQVIQVRCVFHSPNEFLNDFQMLLFGSRLYNRDDFHRYFSIFASRTAKSS